MLLQGILKVPIKEELSSTGKLPTGYTDMTSGGQIFATWISAMLSLTMVIATLALLVNFVWGAMTWVSSGGDKGRLEAARNRIITSVVGMLVLASVIVLFMMVQYFLGIEVLKFTPGSTGTAATPPVCAGGTTWNGSCCYNYTQNQCM